MLANWCYFTVEKDVVAPFLKARIRFGQYNPVSDVGSGF
jgi:hypothetical protein